MTCGWLWCLLVGLPFPCLVDVVLLCLFSFDFVFTFVDYLTCWKFVCMVNCLLLIGVNLICLYVFWLVCLQVWLWFGFLVSFVGVCCFCWIVFLVCWTWRLDFAFVCLWVLERFLFFVLDWCFCLGFKFDVCCLLGLFYLARLLFVVWRELALCYGFVLLIIVLMIVVVRWFVVIFDLDFCFVLTVICGIVFMFAFVFGVVWIFCGWLCLYWLGLLF